MIVCYSPQGHQHCQMQQQLFKRRHNALHTYSTSFLLWKFLCCSISIILQSSPWNIQFDSNIATTQLNSTQSWVSLIFLWKPQTTNHKPQNQTVSHFISAPTQPNSTKFSMQPYFNPTRRFMPKKIGSAPLPPKKSKFKIWFWTNSKLNSTKFIMPPYFNLN